MSATTNRRERRMRETAARLTSVTRRLTAERGLAGFTIEEVCEEVDVSRRTFFNYFPSKEDAVLGGDPEQDTEQLATDFLARAAGGWDKALDDLVELVVEHFESAGVDAAAHAEFLAATDREPRLLLRFMGVSRERDRQAVALVAVREGVEPDDPRAEAVVMVLSTLIRMSAERYLDVANFVDFATIIRTNLAAMRDVLTPRKARS